MNNNSIDNLLNDLKYLSTPDVVNDPNQFEEFIKMLWEKFEKMQAELKLPIEPQALDAFYALDQAPRLSFRDPCLMQVVVQALGVFCVQPQLQR